MEQIESVFSKIELTMDLSKFQKETKDDIVHNLGVMGDALLCGLKDKYKEEAKKYGLLFGDHIVYYCEEIFDGKAKLAGVVYK